MTMSTILYLHPVRLVNHQCHWIIKKEGVQVQVFYIDAGLVNLPTQISNSHIRYIQNILDDDM